MIWGGGREVEKGREVSSGRRWSFFFPLGLIFFGRCLKALDCELVLPNCRGFSFAQKLTLASSTLASMACLVFRKIVIGMGKSRGERKGEVRERTGRGR